MKKYLEVNKVEITKSDLPNKVHCENLTKELLAEYNLVGLPVSFCRKNGRLYPIPVILRKFKADWIIAYHSFKSVKEEKVRSFHSIAKLYYLQGEYFKLDSWGLQKFLSATDFPSFFDKKYCEDFCLNSKSTVEPILSYSPRNNTSTPKSLKKEPAKPEEYSETDSLSVDSFNPSTAEFATKTIHDTETPTEKTENLKNDIIIDEIKSEPKKMTTPNLTIPKLQLQTWENLEKDGCCLEWFRNSKFLVNLNAKSASDGSKISLILNAIKNTDLKGKIITDLEELEESEQTLTALETAIEKNTARDAITYRKLLKKLEYNAEEPMAELYSKITRLVQKSMSLDPKTEKTSIEKLSTSWFLEKIPKAIKQQMQTASFTEGSEIVPNAEKIRSFQRLFLSGDAEKQVNLVQKNDHPKTDEQKTSRKFNPQAPNTRDSGKRGPKCYNCQEYGHISRNCPRKDTSERPHHNQEHYSHGNVYDSSQSHHNRYYRNGNNHHDSRRSNWNQNDWPHQNERKNVQENTRRNVICDYCGRNGHVWANCYMLQGMIQRGKVSPNWAPPKAIEQRPNQGGRAPNDANPLFK